MRNVLHNHPDLDRPRVECIRDLMNAHVLDCLVTGYEELIPALTLPDPNDRHVLAAAIHAGADIIVTANLSDFPPDALAKYGIEVQHPDEFINQLLDHAPNVVCSAVRRQRASLKNPPKSVAEFLESLKRAGLIQTALGLKPFVELI